MRSRVHFAASLIAHFSTKNVFTWPLRARRYFFISQFLILDFCIVLFYYLLLFIFFPVHDGLTRYCTRIVP